MKFQRCAMHSHPNVFKTTFSEFFSLSLVNVVHSRNGDGAYLKPPWFIKLHFLQKVRYLYANMASVDERNCIMDLNSD